MKIGIIGAGVIGKTLARKLVEKGNDVRISNSRGPESLQEFAKETGVKPVTASETVKDVEVVVLTIPLGQIAKIKDLFNDVSKDVIIIETMNYYPMRDGKIEEIEQGLVNSAWVEKVIGRPVIKAFNNIGAYSFFADGKPEGAPDRIALAVSGDDDAAKKVVIEIVNQTGFDGYDAGSIADSWRHQPGTPAYGNDLTLNELKLALEKAVKDEAPAVRDILVKKYVDLGEEHMQIILGGDYPEEFVDKAVDLSREYFGFSDRNKK